MVQFTKKAITEAFVELLNERPLDKITVKDIVTHCGVNRNTFYYYYQDIYSLVDDMFMTRTAEILGSELTYSTWQEAFYKATEFALENRQAIYHIYKSVSRERLEEYLYSVTYSNMLKFVKSAAKGADEKDIALLSEFYAYALLGKVLRWLGDGMKEDPSEFIGEAAVLLEGNIEYTLLKKKPDR